MQVKTIKLVDPEDGELTLYIGYEKDEPEHTKISFKQGQNIYKHICKVEDRTRYKGNYRMLSLYKSTKTLKVSFVEDYLPLVVGHRIVKELQELFDADILLGNESATRLNWKKNAMFIIPNEKNAKE